MKFKYYRLELDEIKSKRFAIKQQFYTDFALQIKNI